MTETTDRKEKYTITIRDRQPYSYRIDPSIPDFSDDGPRTVMDARCSLCAHGARWIARNDTNYCFRIIPLQSTRGAALMRHYGLDPDNPYSWLFIENGKAYTSLDAIIRVGNHLGGFWKILTVLRLMPPPVQNALYGFIARNRYRFFGRTDLCSIPDKELQRRLLS